MFPYNLNTLGFIVIIYLGDYVHTPLSCEFLYHFCLQT